MSEDGADPRTITQIDQPALSLSEQPSLFDLMHGVADANQEITIICGAGVSKDSGLPSWRELLERLTDYIQPNLKDIVTLDPVDLPRKAEYVLELRKTKAPTLEAFVSQGLYADDVERLPPGVLADAIARLVCAVPNRVRVMTTNYDNRLELALRGRASGLKVTPRGLKDARRWWESDRNQRIEVLHLHGYIPPGKSAKHPIILSESYYLRYGPKVRKHITKALQESLVIFVGMSLNDPNLIGPLHRARNTNAYALMVPDSPEPRGIDPPGSLALAYCAAQAQCRYKDFKVQTVILKSYGQVTQCINELAVAATPGSGYLDPVNEMHYGVRFRRIMGRIHNSLKTSEGHIPACGTDGSEVSDALSEALNDPDGPAEYIKSFARRNVLKLDRLGITDPHQRAENFALFLWVRELPNRDSWSRYEICLAGSSAYSHRKASTLHRKARVEADSPVSAARAVFFGRTFLDVVKSDERTFRTWETFHAAPLHLAESDFDPSCSNLPVCIGAVSLNSNHRTYECDPDEPTPLPPRASILSAMSPKQQDELAQRITVAAKRAILSLATM